MGGGSEEEEKEEEEFVLCALLEVAGTITEVATKKEGPVIKTLAEHREMVAAENEEAAMAKIRRNQLHG